MIQLSDSALARLQVIMRPKAGAEPQPDVDALEGKIISALRSWNDELTNILIQTHGEEVGSQARQKVCKSLSCGLYGRYFPAGRFL